MRFWFLSSGEQQSIRFFGPLASSSRHIGSLSSFLYVVGGDDQRLDVDEILILSHAWREGGRERGHGNEGEGYGTVVSFFFFFASNDYLRMSHPTGRGDPGSRKIIGIGIRSSMETNVYTGQRGVSLEGDPVRYGSRSSSKDRASIFFFFPSGSFCISTCRDGVCGSSSLIYYLRLFFLYRFAETKMAGGITSWLFVSSYHGFATTGAKGNSPYILCAIAVPCCLAPFSLSSPFLLDFRPNRMIVR